ncbi:MAG: histidinol-phosphatase HisJ family protein [Tissierellia bacterium]|nr:histidinol-phosphatase HisJ family protein [Tissierellia bacterium]
MNKYIDQHMHSSFSIDSFTSIEEYLNTTCGKIITTEHIDFDCVVDNGRDALFDYEKYVKEIERLKNIYGDRILKGVEIGYEKTAKERISKYLLDKEFDLLLLSVHQGDGIDYMWPLERDEFLKILPIYYEQVLESIEVFHEHFDIVAHLDFILRNKDYSMEDIYPHEERLVAILEAIKKYDLQLELNTRGLFKFENVEYYDYLFNLYRDLGGKKISIGSDAHITAHYKLGFDEAIDFVKGHGLEIANIKDEL